MNSNILYNLACFESLRNNHAKALELLRKVIELDKNYIKRAILNKGFDNIRGLKEFEELISD